MSAPPGFPTTRAAILAAGFKGLHTIDALLAGQYASAPDLPGVYAVFRLADPPPRFTARNAAPRWKGRDPTIGLPALTAAWIDDAALIYLKRAQTLRTGVRQLVEFGNGKMVAHWGGRAIWQLADQDQLVVAWRLASDAKAAEAELLHAFEATYGAPPWANQLDKA